jgi:hypothetical protein
MSAEGLRDMKTMLAQLEAEGPFDHTEGLLSNKDPKGFLGTDFLGYAWRDQRIKQLEEELKQEKNEHQGTKAETDKLRKKVADELTRLKIKIGQEYGKLEAAHHSFQQEIQEDVIKLQQQSSK